MSIPGTYPLQPVDTGRLYFREFGNGMAAFVGVVDVPAGVPDESLMAARLNDKLWLDAEHAERLAKRAPWPNDADIGGLITDIQWRGGAVIPDAFETGVRACALQHEDPARRWVYVFGALQKPLPAVRGGGLFELTSSGVDRISNEPYAGMSIHQVLREPLWGPEGRYGLAHSMNEPGYVHLITVERERSARQDPMFARFLERAKAELAPSPLVYTREENEAHERAVSAIVRALINNDTSSPAPASKSPTP